FARAAVRRRDDGDGQLLLLAQSVRRRLVPLRTGPQGILQQRTSASGAFAGNSRQAAELSGSAVRSLAAERRGKADRKDAFDLSARAVERRAPAAAAGPRSNPLRAR